MDPASPRRAEEEGGLSDAEKAAWKAFEIAKPRMCGQAAKQIIEVLSSLKRYPDYKNASAHPFYAKIKGKGHMDAPECFYYPYLLVLQAIWPSNASVQRIAKAFSKYWGSPYMWNGPHWYPKLNDREREMKLFMGGKQHVDEMEDEEKVTENMEGKYDKEDANIPERETTPDIDEIRGIKNTEELDTLESLFEKREEELMAQVQRTKETVRAIQECKRDRYRKKCSMSKRVSEELKKQFEEEVKIHEYWARKESEYTRKLEQSSATPPVVSSSSENEKEPSTKRQRRDETEEGSAENGKEPPARPKIVLRLGTKKGEEK
ncbi:hypothetical protein FBEOM_1857 [Fusarium beomiforme]|uniref:Uncharacterized protein n=1 Tax=Fusarium beomiforme TaxID=44412 RepID=A0A9P5ASZ6_9HYPO|nr:hypothetical protein FBEOM_1857 [Fusarium beomiforme]